MSSFIALQPHQHAFILWTVCVGHSGSRSCREKTAPAPAQAARHSIWNDELSQVSMNFGVGASQAASRDPGSSQSGGLPPTASNLKELLRRTGSSGSPTAQFASFKDWHRATAGYSRPLGMRHTTARRSLFSFLFTADGETACCLGVSHECCQTWQAPDFLAGRLEPLFWRLKAQLVLTRSRLGSWSPKQPKIRQTCNSGSPQPCSWA